MSGGYPAALARSTPKRRATWYRDYVETLVQRDVRSLGRISSLDALPRLLQLEHRPRFLKSGLVDFFAVANLDDEHYVGWLDRVDDAPVLHTQPPCTLEAVPQRLAKLHRVRREFLFYGPPDSVANVLG